MHSRLLTVCLILACVFSVAAQEDRSTLEIKRYAAFEGGDGVLSLCVGTSLPLLFFNPNTGALSGPNAYPGFGLSLSYLHFLDSHWARGGDVGGGFINTLADRRFFMAPIAARAAYFIDLSPIAIAPSIGLGMAVSSLGDYKHIDPLVKLGSAFLWRINKDVSYGLNIFANVVPQFYKDSTQNMLGVFGEATLSLTYHL